MRMLNIFWLLLVSISLASSVVYAQADSSWVSRLNLAGGLPPKLLATRTVVFYDYLLTDPDQQTIQEYCQRAGIDAVAYFETDMLWASQDVTRAFAHYFEEREIENLMMVEHLDERFRVTITNFNKKASVVDEQQPAWSASDRVLTEVLKTMYRAAASSGQSKTNLLINNTPEPGQLTRVIEGKRNEFYASDLKVDLLAVPRLGNPEADRQLEELMKANYPLKYQLTDPKLTEKELRKQGFLYVMCFVHTRGAVAKSLMGYDMSKAESALVSITYPGAEPQLRNIPSDQTIYKLYFKHIDSQNVFLGNKWDADLTWQQALLNHIRAMKTELRIN